MITAQQIPTIFAQSLAMKVKLLPIDMNDVPGENEFTVPNALLRLSAFQQMAIACPYDEAIIAYHGVDLSEEQTAALMLIHKTTTPWLIGHVIAELIDSDSLKKNAEFILTQLIKDGKVDQKVAKELIVKLQVIDATKPATSTDNKK